VPPKPKIEKKRLDVLVAERGLAESRQKAQAMILAGEVWIGEVRGDKAGALLPLDAHLEIKGTSAKYASRAGLKLEGVLHELSITVAGLVCLDVGASTGGFTDCLLAHGARHVYAVDVTTDQLAWRLQKDPRVTQIKENARNLRAEQIPEPVQFVTMDVSFIAAAKVLPAVIAAVGTPCEFLILVKPQFELDRKDIGKGGIVRDPNLHVQAVDRVRAAAIAGGLRIGGVRPSQVPGAEGNLEFFLHAYHDVTTTDDRAT
jgi:23S rRNA (cytidine1920-2'-O)/16S rRNA (cytidine1409-2'-O)-methyltransferase